MQQVKVVKRSHPRGEEGTEVSLLEVAKRAAEGRVDPRTRSWAIEKIVDAGNPETKREKAEALLEALRRERIYVEDPTDAEFIPSAACTLEGCNGLVFLGEDCDGLLVAFLAACGSVGIHGAVVGHSYQPSGNLEHVLAAIYDGERWHLCDPSTKEPFGKVATPKRERWVDVVTQDIMCDQSPRCSLTGRNVSMRSSGDFVGVGQPNDDDKVERYVGPALHAVMMNSISSAIERLDESWQRAKAKRIQLELIAEEMNENVIDDTTWTQKREDYFRELEQAAPAALEYSKEAKFGDRPVAWNTEEQETVVLGDKDELQVKAETTGEIEVTTADPGDVEQVLHPGVIAGVIIVVAVSTVVSLAIISDVVERHLTESINARLLKIYEEQVAKGVDPDEAAESVVSLSDALTRRAEAEAASQPSSTSTFSAIGDALKSGTYAIVAIGVVAFGAWAVSQIPTKKEKTKRRDEKVKLLKAAS